MDSNILYEISDLVSESDTEQKFIMPLLTGVAPCGFGFAPSEIFTKKTIFAKIIGKGANKKTYVPDYLISVQGLPVVIIEAKIPGGLNKDAFYEAQLYAHAVNSKFKHNCNPCQLIIATDGLGLQAGYFDSSEPEITMFHGDFAVGNLYFEKLCQLFNRFELIKRVEGYFKELRSDSRFIKPVSNLGTKLVQNQELPGNSFGESLAFKYQHIFTPDTEEDKMSIVENAYVHSMRREHHADPIYSIVKRDISPLLDMPLIDTERPELFVNKIEEQVRKKKSLILLVGSKGSGKSIFVRHLYAKKLIPSVKDATQWIYIDMNNANMDIPYEWITREIYSEMERTHYNDDFSSYETIRKVFKEDISDFEKGLGSLLTDEKEYNSELYNHLKTLFADASIKLQKYMDFFLTKRNKTAIIVFDNCDKLESENQLKTFSIAEWLRDSFPVLIIMPIRDSTYDNFYTAPPLDTVIKDLVFRIDPPDFFKVLQKRLNYMFFLSKQEKEQRSYNISDTTRVLIKENEHVEYFKSILASIRNSNYAKDIFYGLTGRNIRYGIETFLNFCRSAHIQAADFFKMRMSDGNYSLPHHVFLNALMRMNRRYYSSDSSPIKNLFSSKYTDIPPDPFVRLDILKLLTYVRRNPDKFNHNRFITVQDLLTKLTNIGHMQEVVHRELNSLVAADLVTYESKSLVTEPLGLIAISSSGSQHLNLLSNINYLAACSEDTYYRDLSIATAISERIKYQSFEDKVTTYQNANDLIRYLLEYRDTTFAGFKEVKDLGDEGEELLNLAQCTNCLERFDEKNLRIKQIANYQPGAQVEFRVTYIQPYGLFGLFDHNIKGFIHVSDVSDEIMELCEEGDILLAEIVKYSEQHNRFKLNYINIL